MSQDVYADEDIPSSGGGSLFPSSGENPAVTPRSDPILHDEEMDDYDIPSESQAEQQRSIYKCDTCKSTLKTLSGFKKHKVLHIINNYQKNVSKDEILSKSKEMGDALLREMLLEPAIGDLGMRKKKCIQSLLECALDTEPWIDYLKFIYSKFLDIVFVRTRVSPQQQYADNLKVVHSWLTNVSVLGALHNKLKIVTDADNDVVKVVNYRVCTKLLDSLQILFIKMVRVGVSGNASMGAPVLCDGTLNESEKETLIYSTGSIIRIYCRRGQKSISPVWKARIKCIEEKFKFNESEEYSENFVELMRWVRSKNRGGLIVISEVLYNFFLGLELLLRAQTRENPLVSFHLENILQEIFKCENSTILEMWFLLTVGYMNEEESLLFMEDIVTMYVHFSGRAEASRRLREEEQKSKVQKVALRTNLKRN